MLNETLIAETDRLLAALPEEQARTVRDFAALLAQQIGHNLSLVDDNLSVSETEDEFRASIQIIQQYNPALDFLNDEPDIYTESDLIERYR